MATYFWETTLVPLILDTGVLYAYYDRRDDWHKRVLRLIRKEEGGLIVPAAVIPEVDHLLGRRIGVEAQLVFYKGFIENTYFVAELERESYARIAELNRQFADLALGFADAAVIATAEQLGVRRVATTDRRDFEPLAREFNLELLPE